MRLGVRNGGWLISLFVLRQKIPRNSKEFTVYICTCGNPSSIKLFYLEFAVLSVPIIMLTNKLLYGHVRVYGER